MTIERFHNGTNKFIFIVYNKIPKNQLWLAREDRLAIFFRVMKTFHKTDRTLVRHWQNSCLQIVNYTYICNLKIPVRWLEYTGEREPDYSQITSLHQEIRLRY